MRIRPTIQKEKDLLIELKETSKIEKNLISQVSFLSFLGAFHSPPSLLGSLLYDLCPVFAGTLSSSFCLCVTLLLHHFHLYKSGQTPFHLLQGHSILAQTNTQIII